MAAPETKDISTTLENITCVYCGQVMGSSSSKFTKNPDTQRQELTVFMEDNPDLPELCQTSPDKQHANMTPTQAKELGLI